MRNLLHFTALVCVIQFGAWGCSNYKSEISTAEGRAALENRAQSAIQRFKQEDASMKRFFDTAAGYTVFPTVGKGAVGVGGAFGRGVVYEAANVIGYATLTQGTIGVQLGGQAYSEIIFFQHASNLADFKSGNYEFSAQASAVAATAGASADADYAEGTAVFTLAKGGLMFEASIGGQKFGYSDAP